MEGGVAAAGGYQPPAGFVEDQREPLLDLKLTDSTELWLIQWPRNTPPDFNGQEVTLKLNHDGKLGSFEGSSGKEYDVVSYSAQEPDATVFLSSSSGSKIVGKISRRVSLVHYPDPTELEKLDPSNLKQLYQKPDGTSMANTSHQFPTPTQSTKLRGSRTSSKYAASSHGSRQRGASLEAGEASRSRKRAGESSGPRDHVHSGVTSEHSRGHNSAVSSGSMGNSHQKSPKKKKKSEE
ncbi:mediator-associated protein 2 isoform X1 [Punica granatum]|nr:mediator-associated protein 2 isoform X1 [Punica granatum]